MGSGANFQQPNHYRTTRTLGRDAQAPPSPQYRPPFSAGYTLFRPGHFSCTLRFTNATVPITFYRPPIPITPLSDASRSGFALGIKSDLSHSSGAAISSKRELISSNSARAKASSLIRAANPDTFPAFQGMGPRAARPGFYLHRSLFPVAAISHRPT